MVFKELSEDFVFAKNVLLNNIDISFRFFQ